MANELQRRKTAEMLRELSTALPKMHLEHNKLSSIHRVDINLLQLARELDELEGHNATVTVYMDAKKIIEKELLPIANKLQQMYRNASSVPLLVYEIGGVLNESNG